MLRALPRLGITLARRCISTRALAALPRVDHQALLSARDIERVNEDGAMVVRQALATPWLEVLREAAENNLKNPGPLCDEHAASAGTSGRFHDDQFLWHRHPAFEEYVMHSGMGALAARAMGSKTAHILYDQLFVKEPGTPNPTPWHNDTSYWHLRGEQIVSVWLALDEVPRERGLSYVKGSHRWGLLHRITNFSGSDDVNSKNVYPGADKFPPVPDIDAGVASGEFELLSWDMVPGDVLIFYSAMMHGSPGIPANSPHRRRGYATRWCGDDIVFEDRIGTMHRGWKAAGFDNGLQNGDPIGCSLHPNVLSL